MTLASRIVRWLMPDVIEDVAARVSKRIIHDNTELLAEIGKLRLDINALRVAQAKAQHRAAAEANPETLGKPFGLSKEQAEQVDWSRVR